VNRIDVRDCYVKESGTFYMGIVSKGSGRIVIGKQTFPVSEGSKFFVPHQTGSIVFESDGVMEIIATFPPDFK